MRWRWQPAAERRSEVITQLLLLVVVLLAVFCSIITDTCSLLTRITFNHLTLAFSSAVNTNNA